MRCGASTAQLISLAGDNGSEVCVRAVKMLRGAASAEDRVEFLREAELMVDFDHQNLVRLIGVAVQQRPWLVVLEYMRVRARCPVAPLMCLQYGDLRGVVRACKERNIKLAYLEQLKFCVQIAAGMAYLAGVSLCCHVTALKHPPQPTASSTWTWQPATCSCAPIILSK